MISILFLVLAGICKACMDVLNFKFDISVFKKWKYHKWINPRLSHRNKWKYVNDVWKGERFWGSSTIFVFVTDLWHFCQALMILFFVVSIMQYDVITRWWLVDGIVLYMSFTVPFELFYSKILIKKRP